MWDPYAGFRSTVLQNGLTIHATHWPERPWEVLGILIHSGAEHDPDGLEGALHFVEHLVSNNAPVSKQELRAFFRGCGGTASFGMTGYPCTYYSCSVPLVGQGGVLREALSLFGPMLLTARLRTCVERERKVIVGEFYRKYPSQLIWDLTVRKQQALYTTSHWLGRKISPLGNLDSIGRITQDDLQACYDTHYTPRNMSIVGVGGMQLSELATLISESPFASEKGGVRTLFPPPIGEVRQPVETHATLEVSRYSTAPVDVGSYQSVAVIPGTTSRHVVCIVDDMLSELLHEEVRERRAWTYAIGSSWTNFRHNYEFSVTCRSVAVDALEYIEQVVEGCIEAIGRREDLFEAAKRHLLARGVMVDITGADLCEKAMMQLAHHEHIVPLEESRSGMERVTMGDVRTMLAWLKPARRWTLIVRP